MPRNMLRRSYNYRTPNTSRKHKKCIELYDSSAYAWQFFIVTKRFITESKKPCENGCVAWRDLLSCQAISGQNSRIYEKSHKL